MVYRESIKKMTFLNSNIKNIRKRFGVVAYLFCLFVFFPLSTISRLKFGTVPAVWYICFSFYCNFDKSITPCIDKGPSCS